MYNGFHSHLYRSNEDYRGELLLAIYRHHADLLFQLNDVYEIFHRL